MNHPLPKAPSNAGHIKTHILLCILIISYPRVFISALKIGIKNYYKKSVVFFIRFFIDHVKYFDQFLRIFQEPNFFFTYFDKKLRAYYDNLNMFYMVANTTKNTPQNFRQNWLARRRFSFLVDLDLQIPALKNSLTYSTQIDLRTRSSLACHLIDTQQRGHFTNKESFKKQSINLQI